MLLLRQLAVTRGPLLRLLGWSGVEALPPLLSGLLVSAAVDQGFLAGRPGAGVAWLAGFGAAMAFRAYAARAGFPYLAAVVEPLRDALVERVVHSALARPSADPAEVARLTEQVESARQLTATLLRTLRGVGVTLAAALVGLALLAPAVLPLVLLPLLAAGFLFARLLRPLVARRRTVVLAEERLAAEAGRALRGLRDVQATGTREQVAEALTRAARASAAASRALGRASALRALVVALGGRLPVLAVLAAAPRLLAREALTPGELLGVATYLLQQLDPSVRTLAGTVGGWLLNLAVVLDRLAATTINPPADTAPSALPGRAPGQEPEVRVSELRYRHSRAGAAVLEGLEVGFGAGEHVAVVLDEATCHLDARAEDRIERAFAARPGTLVVVAHRISSALRADRVLLLDGGRGVLARHGDLQVLSPLYRELVGHWLGSTAGRAS
ncbi:hypothetical protein ACIPLC_03785 [Kitasatospora sp. NPDC086801]|uniref:hypothetical protein n=1 Tax=Kitasatospora sp. NPDC086801 TaxID=3364066 RepID=UPI00381F1C3D